MLEKNYIKPSVYCYKGSPADTMCSRQDITPIYLDDIGSAVFLPEDFIMVRSEHRRISAEVIPATDASVAWTSSAPDVVSVTDGLLTALKPGTATITATAGGVSGSCTVTVLDVKFLTLPSGLTEIEEEAFMDDASIEAVIVPEGCESIGFRAFAWCENLVYIRVPAGTYINEYAFEYDDGVTIERVG